MAQELDSEMTDEQRERMMKSGMGTGMGGINVGVDTMFGEARPGWGGASTGQCWDCRARAATDPSRAHRAFRSSHLPSLHRAQRRR